MARQDNLWWRFTGKLRSRWSKARHWAIRVLVVAVLLVVAWFLYEIFVYSWPIAPGFDEFVPASEKQRPDTGYLRAKTLWDFVQLLFIPVVLAGVGYFFNRAQQANAETTAEQQAKTEREIAERRTQDETLEKYLDHIAVLLIDKKMKSQPTDEVEDIARVRTLTALRRLDGDRNKTLIQFLRDADLFGEQSDPGKPNINLSDMSRANLSRANLSRADLSGANLQRADLSRTDLSRTDLSRADLSRADLSGANLQRASLTGADLTGADLTGADLSAANLTGADLTGADLTGADLTGADLTGAYLIAATIDPTTRLDHKWRLVWEIINRPSSNRNLSKNDLSGANLTEADLSRANLTEANLSGANLTKANLSAADLTGTNLTRANLSRVRIDPTTRLDHKWRLVWEIINRPSSNRSFRENDLSGANLSTANLAETDLSGANLTEADLSGANLTEANLSAADLTEANLSVADLRMANLQGANLQEANLQGANLQEANLSRANLQGADLLEANLQGVNLQQVFLGGAILKGAKLQGTNLQGAIMPDGSEYE